MNGYEQARRRVDNTPELRSHEDFIFYDDPLEDDEYFQWVATAPAADIIKRASMLERNSWVALECALTFEELI